MKIKVAKSAGFCFGVKRALHIAFETVRSGAQIEMLGDIVHNEKVVEEITKAGIKKITHLGKGKDKVLLIPAHGAPQKIFKKARGLGYSVVDATCPMVKEIHKIVKDSEKKGYKVIIIGDKKHDEVRGIAGQLKKKPIVIDNIKNLPLKKIKIFKSVAVVVQSTQNLNKVLGIVNALKQNIKELKFLNTICKPTRIKQEEIKVMPLENDTMIIIGSKASANTKRLYQISKSLNKRSFWIQSKDNIRREWFKDAKTVGVTAGASTPDSTTKDVIEYIRAIN